MIWRSKRRCFQSAVAQIEEGGHSCDVVGMQTDVDAGDSGVVEKKKRNYYMVSYILLFLVSFVVYASLLFILFYPT